MKYYFYNFKIEILLGDCCILPMIPDYKSSPRGGHVTVQWFRKRNDFCFSQELPETEGAARAEPSLLELCRVASEEDEVNSQEFVRNLFCLV